MYMYVTLIFQEVGGGVAIAVRSGTTGVAIPTVLTTPHFSLVLVSTRVVTAFVHAQGASTRGDLSETHAPIAGSFEMTFRIGVGSVAVVTLCLYT